MNLKEIKYGKPKTIRCYNCNPRPCEIKGFTDYTPRRWGYRKGIVSLSHVVFVA